MPWWNHRRRRWPVRALNGIFSVAGYPWDLGRSSCNSSRTCTPSIDSDRLCKRFGHPFPFLFSRYIWRHHSHSFLLTRNYSVIIVAANSSGKIDDNDESSRAAPGPAFGKCHPAVVNVGFSPTFDEQNPEKIAEVSRLMTILYSFFKLPLSLTFFVCFYRWAWVWICCVFWFLVFFFLQPYSKPHDANPTLCFTWVFSSILALAFFYRNLIFIQIEFSF